MQTKFSTQSWSKAPQTTNYRDEKVNLTPATRDSAASGSGETQALGEKLNAIANPGGKNPLRPTRKADNTLDKDDFLKLMLTQMKNQDPMNPLQSHEMAAQLAQFTSLEQLYNVNKNLESLGRAQEPSQKYEALNFLGKSIKADTRQIFRQAGDQANDMRFDLGADAAKVKVTIADEMGKTLKVIETGNLKKGQNKIAWNGTDSTDRDVKPGRYIFNVEAENAAGRKVAVLTETAGTITGINYTSEGPMLMVGDQRVRLQDVQKIEDAGLRERQNREEGPQTLEPAGNAGEPADMGALLEQAKSLEQQARAAAGYNPQVQVQGQSQAVAKPKVKPESKPEAQLSGAVIPLEVASANATGMGSVQGGEARTGGAFGHR
jgi:flagellar basal-body rod modification protein FlgD